MTTLRAERGSSGKLNCVWGQPDYLKYVCSCFYAKLMLFDSARGHGGVRPREVSHWCRSVANFLFYLSSNAAITKDQLTCV